MLVTVIVNDVSAKWNLSSVYLTLYTVAWAHSCHGIVSTCRLLDLCYFLKVSLNSASWTSDAIIVSRLVLRVETVRSQFDQEPSNPKTFEDLYELNVLRCNQAI